VVICVLVTHKSGRKVSAADLSEAKFIIREAGSGHACHFENTMREAGVTWKVAGLYNNNESNQARRPSKPGPGSGSLAFCRRGS